MNLQRWFMIGLSIILFILGICFMAGGAYTVDEPFISGQCPTTMIKNGESIMIYNPKLAKIPGVNPLMMDNLEDYKEYVDWQKKNNLGCPILYLEKVFDAQGSEMYEIKPSFDTDIPMGGINHSMPNFPKEINHNTMDASRDTPPYNQNGLPGYDPQNQTEGVGSDKMILYPNNKPK